MNPLYHISSYDFELPESQIAQHPVAQRDASKLLMVAGGDTQFADLRFADLVDYLKPGDLLVVNDTRVFPARLLGRKESGGRVELFILEFPRHSPSVTDVPEQEPAGTWREVEAVGLMKSSKRPRPGVLLEFGADLGAEVKSVGESGEVCVTLRFQGELADVLEAHGTMPLPPYIDRRAGAQPADRERYQTIYASQTGAVAAPTAGLHFTNALLAKIRAKGVGMASVTLHVGYGTFAPVRVEDIRQHRIHQEYVSISPATASAVNETRRVGGRVWAVGTTSLRALEFGADDNGVVRPVQDWCGLYIYPGYRFKVVENLITNFHLPRSSLLFMVSALAGRERMLAAYRYAMAHDYRFYSYGDAMAIITAGRQ